MQESAETGQESRPIRRRYHLGVEELLDDQQLIRLPLIGVVRHHFQVERLERVVRVDRHLALQVLDLEPDYTGLGQSEAGQIFLALDDVLQLPPHKYAPEESVERTN